MDKFNQGLLGMMGQPAFQLGVGLLGRNDRPFGQALGGAMQDLQRNQLAQQAAEAQRQRIEAAKQEQARLAQQQQWISQNMPGLAAAPQWAQQSSFNQMISPKAPPTSGGMQFVNGNWEKIPGWTSQAPTVVMPGADKYNEARGKSLDTRINAYQDAARQSSKLQSEINRFNMAMSNARTGGKAATAKVLREWAGRFGFPIDEELLSSAQSIDAAAKAMVAEQLRLNKGPQTDFDARFASEYLPSLDKQADANREISNYLSSVNRLNQLFGRMAGNAYNATGFAQSFSALSDVDRYAMETPAVIQDPKSGVWVDFETFYRAGKKERKSDKDILNEWQATASEYR